MTIIRGDCIHCLKTLGDQSIDLVLTDPPYGINIARTGVVGRGPRFTPKKWDSARPSKKYFDEMRRVSRNQIIWGGNYFADLLPPSRCWLVWYKRDHLPILTFADCELAWTSFDANAQVFNCRWGGFIKDGGDSKKLHPTQKSLAVMKWCIEEFSKPGDTILDPFAGVMTTACAAEALGRKYICIERDPEYIELGKQRLAAA